MIIVQVYKTAVYAISQTLMKMVAGFIVMKIVAIMAGPEGIAQFGFYQNATTIMLMLSGGIVSAGVTSILASNESCRDKAYTYCVLYTRRLGVYSLFFALPSIVFFQYFYIGDKNIVNYILICLSAPAIYLQSRFMLHIAILNGLRQISLLAKRNIQASFLVIFISCFNYWFFDKWQAACFSLCLAPALLYIYITVTAKDNKVLPSFISQKIINNGSNLNRYALAGIASAICMPIAQTLIRSYISETNGEFNTGIWQALNRLSEVYLVLISSVISMYVLPKVSSAKGKKELRGALSPILIFTAAMATVAVLIVYVFRSEFIILLFDSRFFVMERFFIYQLPGDLFKITSWVFSFSLLALGHARVVMLLEIISTIIYVLLVKFGLSALGMKGAFLAYTLSYIIYFLMTTSIFIYWYKKQP